MDKKTEYNKRYYEKNKERLKQEARNYYQENKEAVLEYKKVYNEENKDRRNQRDKEYYRTKGKHEIRMLGAARDRAKRFGLDFDLTVEDIQIPEVCPLLNIPLYIADGKKHAKYNSPSLDRIDSNKGYVKGNVWVISHKANTMKSNSTFEEFRLMADNWERIRNEEKFGLWYNRDSGMLTECKLDEPEAL